MKYLQTLMTDQECNLTIISEAIIVSYITSKRIYRLNRYAKRFLMKTDLQLCKIYKYSHLGYNGSLFTF